jgi:hypothetical protein
MLEESLLLTTESRIDNLFPPIIFVSVLGAGFGSKQCAIVRVGYFFTFKEDV